MKTTLLGLMMALTLTGAFAEGKKQPDYDYWPQRYYDQHGYYEYNSRTNSYEYHDLSRLPLSKKKSPRGEGGGSGQRAKPGKAS
jgi:hypothetical protein